MPAITSPEWTRGLVWYQVHALRALGCPDTNPDPLGGTPQAHRLRDLLPWLDHIRAMGASGLLLTPVFVSQTHGYDTVDPFRIDQRLGDTGDFDALVAACRDRELRIMLDGVLNHVSRQFPRFAAVLAQGPDSDDATWFRIAPGDDVPDGFRYDDFEGHGHLVALNHDAAGVLDWAVDVACHWLERGIDGWRLDAAYAVPTRFWAAFSSRVLDRHPQAYLIGEVIHGDYADFVRASGLHAVTQYELPQAIWSALNDHNFFELSWTLGRHATFAQVFTPHTFIGNHDTSRILTRLDDPTHLGHALAVLFTVPGGPSVYYGDELGFRGAKEEREGGDDAIRPVLPPSPDPADEEQAAIRDLYRHLIGLRAARPWLDHAALEIVEVTNEHLRYRVSDGDRSLLVALNVGTDAIHLGETGQVIAGEGVSPDDPALSAGSWVVLERA